MAIRVQSVQTLWSKCQTYQNVHQVLSTIYSEHDRNSKALIKNMEYNKSSIILN